MIRVVYHRRNPHLRKKKKSILRRRWFWDFVLLFVFCGSLSWLFLKTPYFMIKDIKISGCKNISEKEVRELASVQDNFFLFNSGNISASIKDISFKVQEAKVEKKFPNSILIKIEERKAVGIYCAERKKNKKCYLVSEDGVAFDTYKKEKMERDKKTKNQYPLVKVIDKKNNNRKIGEEVIKRDLFLEIFFLKDSLRKINSIMAGVEIKPFKIIVRIEGGPELYFSDEDIFEAQAETLIKALDKGTIKSNEFKNLNYVDLREVKKEEKGRIYLK